MLKKVKKRAEQLGIAGHKGSAYTYQFTVHVHSAEFVVHDKKWFAWSCATQCRGRGSG